MTLFIKKLRYQNFLSTGNIFTEIDILKSKTTLVVGENGAGKSTIIDALSFVLYNKAHRNINKPQLVNSITAKDCLVEIEFSIGSNEYVVRRGMKPNIFEIYKNDRLINQSAENRDYQKFLEESILRMNHKTFSQIILLGRANFTPFMALPAQGRRQFIEDLLDIQIFSVMNGLLKDKINANKQQILTNEHAIDLIDSKIEMQRKHNEELKANNEELIAERLKKIEELNDQYVSQQGLLQEIESSLSDYEKQKKNLETLAKRQVKQETILGQLDRKRKSLLESIEYYKTTDTCSSCKQTISSDFKAKAIEEKQQNVREVEKAMGDLEAQTRETVERIKEEKRVFERSQLSYQRKVEINSVISLSLRSIDEIKKEVQALRKKNEKILDNRNFESQRQTLINEKEELINHREILALSSTLLKDGGIKTQIIRQYVPIINKLINKYLTMMDFFVQFEIDEAFNEKIKSRYRDEFSYESFSEGEKVRLDLALLFSWRALTKLRNSSTTNLLILDEIFDSSLDLSGTEEFMKILGTLAGDTNVFVISHKTDQLTDKFENVLRFKKVKNFSRIGE